jgi:hypothetical protein
MRSERPKVELETIPFLTKMITVNKAYVGKFLSVHDHIRLNSPYILQFIQRIDSYNPRYIRGDGKVWSYHAYGQAVDINPSQFPAVKGRERYELPFWFECLVYIFKFYGFRWGGDWRTIFDPMHFEIGART